MTDSTVQDDSELVASGQDHGLQVERRSRSIGTRRAFRAIKAQQASTFTKPELVANRLTRTASSATFLVAHAIWFAIWIAWNVGLFGLHAFDPYPFGLLTMIVSLEAIFLSIFVLMAQNRESAIAELREEMTLQVNLRMEEEVTKTLQLVAGLYRRFGHELASDPELEEMLQPLDAEAIERDLLAQIKSIDSTWSGARARAAARAIDKAQPRATR
jgi:uncharacterized membrane protein